MDKVPCTEDSFITCCERDWELHLKSFARNLQSEFNTDSSITSAESNIQQSKIIVMTGSKKSRSGKKPMAKKGNGSKSTVKSRGSRGTNTSKTSKRKRKNSDITHEMDEEENTHRKLRVTQDSDSSEDDDDDGEESDMDSKMDDGLDEDDDDDNLGDDAEDEQTKEVTPEGLSVQRGTVASPGDDDSSFDKMSYEEQLKWVNDKVVANSPYIECSTMTKRFMKGVHSIIKRNLELEEEIKDHRANWDILQLSKKAKKAGKLTVVQQQMLHEAKGAVVKTVCRQVKFPKTGWEMYSTEKKSVFHSMIRDSVSFPTGMSEKQIEVLWNDSIGPLLVRHMTNAKNNILQAVKSRFSGENYHVT